MSTAAISATDAIFLKGCLGNPNADAPGDAGKTVQPTASKGESAIETLPEQIPETTQVSLGYIPIRAHWVDTNPKATKALLKRIDGDTAVVQPAGKSRGIGANCLRARFFQDSEFRLMF